VDEVLYTENIALLFDFVLLRDFNDLVLARLDFRDDRRSLNVLTTVRQSVGDEVGMTFHTSIVPFAASTSRVLNTGKEP
jgi:hypothetical protein